MRRFFILPLSSFLLLLLLPVPLWAQKDGPVLYVGVRTLPEQMSPALAFTYAERQVLDLLFEPLIVPITDDGAGQQYRPRLAERMPHVAPLQREFRIRPGACWSDGQPVTSSDVRDTVLKLKGTDWRGRSGLWRDGRLETRVEDDPAQVRIAFDRGFFEPLSLMSFAVLPSHFGKQPLKLDDPEFAKAPVGSGPYLAPRRVKEDDREYLVFAANPHYRRQGKPPRFSEIRLFAVKDGAKEFQHPAKPMHVWLDAPTEQAGVENATVTNRRIYFLAVNHRVRALAEADLRRAIALGINREAILNKRFRAGKPGDHAALNGPYPAKSWAWSPSTSVPAELYNLDLAKSKVKEKIELNLKYPDDDARVQKACQDIKADLLKLGITLNLVKLSPRLLKEAVDRRDYQLAYYHLDYADETYTLWPIFEDADEASDKGGANFLGYRKDATLNRLLSDLRGHREFSRVKDVTHALHAHLFFQMPFIPLWQLHTHVAFRGVEPRPLDAQHVFANVEDWKWNP